MCFGHFSPWHTNHASAQMQLNGHIAADQLKANYAPKQFIANCTWNLYPKFHRQRISNDLLTFLWFQMTLTLGLPRRENDWSMTSSWIKLAEWIISAIMAIFLWAFTSCGLWMKKQLKVKRCFVVVSLDEFLFNLINSLPQIFRVAWIKLSIVC